LIVLKNAGQQLFVCVNQRFTSYSIFLNVILTLFLGCVNIKRTFHGNTTFECSLNDERCINNSFDCPKVLRPDIFESTNENICS